MHTPNWDFSLLLLNEAIASRAVIAIVAGSAGWIETLLESDKYLKQEAHHQVGLGETRAA